MRHYDAELERISLPREDCTADHPLMGLVTVRNTRSVLFTRALLETVSSQSVETTSAKKGKQQGGKGSKDTASAPPPSDPLQDPLSISAASDPLSAALLDPLSAAAIEHEASSFGVKKMVYTANHGNLCTTYIIC